MKSSIMFFIIFFIYPLPILTNRSPFRKLNKNIPIVTTKWENSKNKIYFRTDEYYNPSPLFTVFNKKHFQKNILPEKIYYGEGLKHSVSKDVFDTLISNLYQEISQGVHIYKDFTILQTKNFNKRKQCGLLVVKCNDYPFVVKLFIENPKTLINPYCKGFENRVFHFMGHGANRHISGLTRIINKEYITTLINASEKWNGKVILPRKWYWTPGDSKKIIVTGLNFVQNSNEKLITEIPSVYAIVADYLDAKKKTKLSTFEKHELIMDFCNDMQFQIDPHTTNFTLIPNDDGSHNIQLIDTEHFPTMVGIHDDVIFTSYIHWYGYLAIKAVQDLYFQNKKDRLIRQQKEYSFPWVLT